MDRVDYQQQCHTIAFIVYSQPTKIQLDKFKKSNAQPECVSVNEINTFFVDLVFQFDTWIVLNRLRIQTVYVYTHTS